MIFYRNILNFSRIVSGKGIDISKMLTSQTSLDVSIKLQIPETISLSYAGFPTKKLKISSPSPHLWKKYYEAHFMFKIQKLTYKIFFDADTTEQDSENGLSDHHLSIKR